MKNLFLDCGSNIGQGFVHFSKGANWVDDHWEYNKDQAYPPEEYDYFLFEPNPYCFQILNKKLSGFDFVKLHNVAVGTKQGSALFSFGRDTGQGLLDEAGSLVLEHNNGSAPGQVTTNVNVINLLDYINEVKDNYNEIVIKIDIESAEYELLEYFIKHDSISLFKKLYIEFHSHLMNDKDYKIFKRRENNILKYLNNNNINYEIWR